MEDLNIPVASEDEHGDGGSCGGDHDEGDHDDDHEGGTDDILIGTNQADILSGGGGADWIDGRQGGDTLKGGGGADTIFGGNGEDSIFGGGGPDVIDGGNGDDAVCGGGGGDQIGGGQGNDVLLGAGGADRIDGGQGNDILQGEAGADLLIGGPGADIFAYVARSDAPARHGEAEDDGHASADLETILDFEAGIDRLDFRALGGLDFADGAGALHIWTEQDGTDALVKVAFENGSDGLAAEEMVIVLQNMDAAGIGADSFLV